MRKIIENGISWLNRSLTREESAPPTESQPVRVEPKLESAASELLTPEIPTPEPTVQSKFESVMPPVAVTQEALVTESIQPEPVILEVTILVRGARQYATCPHCQMNWNIQEQLNDPRRRSGTSQMKRLVCPACDKPVSLPGNVELRRVH